MSKIYIFGSKDDALEILGWLSEEGGIAAWEVAAIVDFFSSAGGTKQLLSGVPMVAAVDIMNRLSPEDIIIVAEEGSDEIIETLFSREIFNVYDGNAVIRNRSIAQRFLTVGEALYMGPTKPAHLDPDRINSRRYFATALKPGAVPRSTLFVVNSMPKSGTIWMMAMLEAVMGVRAEQNIILSHVRDIEMQWSKRNLHGGMALVRDIRDVVVSWFHHLIRADLQCGFSPPRYPDHKAFYFDYFLGQIFGSDRYYHGDLAKWLDFIGLNSIPVVKYEELITDAHSCLRKVMTFWKVDVTDQLLTDVARDFRFDNMKMTVAGRRGLIADMLNEGHLRRGHIGAWKEELPAEVVKDISWRFREYQSRLRYT
jgi:hypothetical protein